MIFGYVGKVHKQGKTALFHCSCLQHYGLSSQDTFMALGSPGVPSLTSLANLQALVALGGIHQCKSVDLGLLTAETEVFCFQSERLALHTL